MNVSLDSRWQSFVDELVEAGRYPSADDVVREGLRLVEERETKLQALRGTLNASIEEADRVGWLSPEEVDAQLDEAYGRAKVRGS